MNENIDLTKILEGCPVGTEFYSTIHGTVSFRGIDLGSSYPVMFDSPMIAGVICLTKKGRALLDVGECIIFPSKDQRDWSKFIRFWDKSKIKKFDINTLQPFDKILARDEVNHIWTCALFSHIDNSDPYYPIIAIGICYKKCIPYNDETKHLIGTTEDCPEYYKWWKE